MKTKKVADWIVFITAAAALLYIVSAESYAQEVPCGGTCGDQTNYQQTHVNIDNSVDRSRGDTINNSMRDESNTATGGSSDSMSYSQSQGGSGGSSSSNAEGGVSNASAQDNSQTSVSSNTDNSSSFLSLSLSLVQASGCWGGVNAGGGEDNTAGFLGISWLNNDCWMDKIAARTQDAEHNAELKCHSKKFRNALGWDVPRRDRRKHCIDEVTQSNLELIEFQKTQMQDAITVIEQECSATEESLRRCEVAWKNALNK